MQPLNNPVKGDGIPKWSAIEATRSGRHHVERMPTLLRQTPAWAHHLSQAAFAACDRQLRSSARRSR